MNHCPCIFAQQREHEDVILFEGNHTLPFFWLMLIDKEDVEICREKMMSMSTEDINHVDTSIVLDKLKALSHAASRRDYVKKHLTTCLSLFDDWLYYLQISDFSDMKIYVDIYPIRSSYNNVNAFIDSIMRAVICIDEDIEAWNEATIAATCGYENQNNNRKPFSALSHAYRELNKKSIYGHFDKKIHLSKKMTFRKKRWLFVVVLSIIIALTVGIILLAL